MHTHSVENRFILIVCAALLLFVAPLFALFFYLSAERSMHEILDRAKVAMTSNAQALGKPLWDFDLENVRHVAATVVSEPNIVAVRVGDSSGQVDIRLPENMTIPKPGLLHLSRPIFYSSADGERQVGQLDVYIKEGGLLSTVSPRDIAFIAIFALAILIVFAASLIVNRVIVIRPLLRLTEAIVATRNLGSRHQVDWNSNDEMGILARNFNEMQKELAREETELKSAHALVQSIYNQTPAMLYSLDGGGRIVSVSDYWLRAAGYQRSDVIGRSFADFIDPSAQQTYSSRTIPEAGGASTPGVTVKFICADSSTIDVLIRETATRSDAGRSLTLSVMTDVTELRQAEIRNRTQAITDHLTGLFNRQGFEAALDEKIRDADARQEELACLFVDLDGFKWINDNLGHAAGDEVLISVVSRMKEQLRPTDIVARLGGDEFAILVPFRKNDNIANKIARRINGMFDQPFVVDGNVANLSASLGIALYPTHAASAPELLQKADMAMYARKRNGKNGSATFNADLAEASRRRAEMELNISIGLREDRFEAWMQPIVDLKTGAISGFEALMRMRHPEKGILPPAEIIAAAEENGSIQAIGDVILRKSIQNIATLSQVPGLERTSLAVNISPIQINGELPLKIFRALLENGVSPDRLVLEITEAVLLQENPDIYEILRGLSQAGIRIALDDFGSGYSSLSYLHRFPVDIVKIDKSFIQAMTPNNAGKRGKSCLLVEGIKTIAHQIGCKVVAEGIEDEHSRSILTEMGIDFGQGYLFARPMSVEDIESSRRHEFRAEMGGKS